MTDIDTATETVTPTDAPTASVETTASTTTEHDSHEGSTASEGKESSRGGRNRRGRGRKNPESHADQAGQTSNGAADASKAGNTQAPKAARPQQPREVHPVLQKLFELYPGLFGARFLPLKLGVFQDLLALHPDAFKKEDLKVALGLHARSTRYLESVAAGHQRHDLNGVAIEPVSPEHVHHAILEIYRRRQSRSRDDLRPHLFAQIVRAIEASGLSRQDYADRVRTQDDFLNEVLDAAVSELAQQAARREALLRTFEASGKTVAEYADMYGLNAVEAEQTLERAKLDRIAAAAHAAAVAAKEAEDALKADQAVETAEAPEVGAPAGEGAVTDTGSADKQQS
ncbi:MAG: hypothetical protein EOO28_05570 [Comamonadaceae bacterium]|nr:MAG: hypothetical protein EOO28_05570 [Comamonadaceae bacterium]